MNPFFLPFFFSFSMSISDFSRLYPDVVFRNKVRSCFPAVSSEAVSSDIKFNDIFPHQDLCGRSIYNLFLDRSIHTVLAVALTQSGKTGVMLSVIRHFISSTIMPIPISNIFIITGHSSADWISQNRERFPSVLDHNIFHRNTLQSFALKIKLLTNVIIFVDESHVACLKSQSIQAALSSAGISLMSLFFRDIKFVLVSATPSSNISRFVPSRPGYALTFMKPAPGYSSIFNMLDHGRVFQSKDLCGFDKSSDTFLSSALDHIRDIPIGVIPKYHIIRTMHSSFHFKTIDNFKAVFGAKCRYLSMPDLRILSIQPFRHTFIFIKDTLRCSKTIDKSHLGVLYERFSKSSSVSSIIQGLAGRATGYHSFPIIIFSNLSSILFYRALWNHRFSSFQKSISWDF